MLHIDRRNPRARTLGEALARRLGDAPLPADLHIVVGGDGWMLTSLRAHGPHGVFLGVNAGRVGFLLNDVDGEEQLAALAGCIRQQAYAVHDFPLLEAEVQLRRDRGTSRTRAVNDVFVERTDGSMALLRLRVDGALVVDELSCDGIIVATALGSTAYSFSAGGVPSHPRAQALHITPICPHGPRLSPFVLPGDSVVEIEVLRGEHRPVRAFSDGMALGEVERATVRPARDRVRLAFLPDHDFTATMVRKILGGGRAVGG